MGTKRARAHPVLDPIGSSAGGRPRETRRKGQPTKEAWERPAHKEEERVSWVVHEIRSDKLLYGPVTTVSPIPAGLQGKRPVTTIFKGLSLLYCTSDMHILPVTNHTN